MSMSVGLRTIGSEAKSVASSPLATLKRLTDSRAASGPVPAGLAANKADAGVENGRGGKEIFVIDFCERRLFDAYGSFVIRFPHFRRQFLKGPQVIGQALCPRPR